MRVNAVGARVQSASRVIDLAPRAKTVGIVVQTRDLGWGTRRLARADRAVEDIVRLVRNVAWVAEQQGGADIAARIRRRVERGERCAGAVVGTAAAGKDITDDVSALAVPAYDEGRVWATGSVVRDGLFASAVTLLDSWAVVRAFQVVVLNVFIVATLVRKVGADSLLQSSLTTGVLLVPALDEEDVNVRTGP